MRYIASYYNQACVCLGIHCDAQGRVHNLQVWSSAHVLLDYLEGSHNVRGKDVLELGAGTGVVGITLGV
jgi:tRNA1(Val) A37 N6-methylase TrmN6